MPLAAILILINYLSNLSKRKNVNSKNNRTCERTKRKFFEFMEASTDNNLVTIVM